MDNRNRPNKLYTTKLDLDISNDEDGQSKRAVDGSQWNENKTVTKLINIVTTLQNESEST
jgi:hypothetical protein